MVCIVGIIVLSNSACRLNVKGNRSSLTVSAESYCTDRHVLQVEGTQVNSPQLLIYNFLINTRYNSNCIIFVLCSVSGA